MFRERITSKKKIGMNPSPTHRRANVKRLAQENALLAKIGKIISSTLYIDEIYERFAGTVRKMISFERISITLTQAERNIFTLNYVSGLDIPDKRKGMVRTLPNTLCDKIRRSRTGLVFNPQNIEEIKEKFPSLISNYQVGLKSYLSVPLLYKDDVIGILHFRSVKLCYYNEQDLRLAQAIAHQIAGAIANAQLFTEHMQALENLKSREEELEIKSKNLEMMNSALELLLKSVEKRKNESVDKILLNIRELVLPYIQTMKTKRDNADLYLEIIEQNLSKICSSFLLNINSKYVGLTPREIQIAQLVKEKKTSKEIADILTVSVRTVNFHRNSLRKKFGLRDRQSNLMSYLLTFE
jgi:DNA-binding CsgD family transcriptional regulator